MRQDHIFDTPTNPQQPEWFAGRAPVFARLQQRILDQPQREAMAFTGQDGMGKTALLRQFTRTFHDPILSVYFPLRELEWTTEEKWLLLLRDTTTQLLIDHNYSMSRLPQLTAPEEGSEPPPLAQWFREEYLPEVLRILRSQRRLVWLFDDAEVLLTKLPAEHLNYLHSLLAEQEQLAIVLTLNSRYEEQLGDLQPLVNPTHAERLHPLGRDETEAFFRQIVPALTDAQITHIWEGSAGFPTLVQRYAGALAGREPALPEAASVDLPFHSARKTTNVETRTDPKGHVVKQVEDTVYTASDEEFRGRWLLLTQDERLVLTACASLRYEDPIQPITAERIERWLVETDYPLDATAIQAALRGLDYRHLVQRRAEGHLEIVGKLFQRWLLEHARLGTVAESTPAAAWNWRLVILVAALLLFMIAAVLLVPPLVSAPVAIPTVTLNP